MTKVEEIASAIESGKMKLISDMVLEAIQAGADPMDILNNGMISAMSVVGERFSRGEAFVPEMLISARTMKKGVETLKPYLSKGAAGANGKVIIGTVCGDMHDIGKNLVAMMIESAGFEVIDLGIDVPGDRFVQSVRDNGDVRIVALSTTTMPAMKSIVADLNKLENRASFRIMVGGAPITAEFAKQIGADVYTTDAASAANMAKSFVS
jgi:5-methyltetrahydrofolate--homocysteine methyltransferase